MAQYQITVDGDMLHQLFRGDEGVGRLLGSVLNQVLEAQVSEHLKAAPFERTEERAGYRNGYRERVKRPIVSRRESEAIHPMWAVATFRCSDLKHVKDRDWME